MNHAYLFLVLAPAMGDFQIGVLVVAIAVWCLLGLVGTILIWVKGYLEGIWQLGCVLLFLVGWIPVVIALEIMVLGGGITFLIGRSLDDRRY